MHLSIENLCFSIEIGAFLCRSFAVRVDTMISFPEKWACGGYGRIIPIGSVKRYAQICLQTL